MFLRKFILFFAFFPMLQSCAAESGSEQVSSDVKSHLRAVIAERLTDRVPDDIRRSRIDGLYEVIFGTQVIYMSADGRYLIEGLMADLEENINLTQTTQNERRHTILAQIDESNMLIYEPEQTKHTITVFTDIDCPYCRMMHSQIEDYLAEGIRVRYLLFPRSAIGSPSWNKAVSVWCAEDRKQAFDDAMSGEEPQPRQCDSQIPYHRQMGERLNVNATPTTINAQGMLIPGFRPAREMAQALEKIKLSSRAAATPASP